MTFLKNGLKKERLYTRNNFTLLCKRCEAITSVRYCALSSDMPVSLTQLDMKEVIDRHHSQSGETVGRERQNGEKGGESERGSIEEKMSTREKIEQA